MYSKFLQLTKEKQDRIINAALKVFSSSDYKNASTDEIAKEAGISKGALFFYFGNKNNLFLYLFDYVINYLSDEIIHMIDITESDFLNRLKQVTLIKMNAMANYPEMFKFILNTNNEDYSAIGLDLVSRSRELSKMGYSLIIDNIDLTKFREDIKTDLAINTIMWASEAFANRKIIDFKNNVLDQTYFDNLLKEYNEYIEFFRKSFYREEN